MKHKKNYPENHADGGRNDRMMEGVYGGPEYFMQQDPRMFQTVYGGPDFFAPNPGIVPAGAPAPTVENNLQTADTTPCKRCPCCGAPIADNAKFCSECGTPIPRDDT